LDTPRLALPGLTVFFPAHNEQGNIARVVQGFSAELPRIAKDWEIVIVDDGSHDDTGNIADQMAAADPHVRVVHHPVNRGYGGAVLSGIETATQPYVLLCDGDGQFEPADIWRLLERVPSCDVVVGRRRRRADHLIRRINGQAWTMLVRLVFGIGISDIDCGFKLFRRESLKGIRLRARGAMISTELIARLAARGARICEVNVNHLPRRAGEQSGNSPRVILRAFRELFTLYQDLRATKLAQKE
jgi:glycosyltransferase involved in cell wall biosynthesis